MSAEFKYKGRVLKFLLVVFVVLVVLFVYGILSIGIGLDFSIEALKGGVTFFGLLSLFGLGVAILCTALVFVIIWIISKI